MNTLTQVAEAMANSFSENKVAESNKKTVTQKNYDAILAYLKLKKSGNTGKLIALTCFEFGYSPRTTKAYLLMFVRAGIIKMNYVAWEFIEEVN